MNTRTLAKIAGLAVLYFAVARAGRFVLPDTAIGPVVAPAAGVALAALLLGGSALWPGVALGAMADALLATRPPLAAAGLALGAGLAALSGAVLLRRTWHFSPRFDRVRDAVGFLLIGALISPTVSALFAVATQGALTAPSADLLWWRRWTADVFGVLLAAPVILTWRAPAPPRYSPAVGGIELVLEAGLLALLSAMVFLTGGERLGALILGVALVAVRQGSRGGALGVAIVAGVGIWVALHGHGAPSPELASVQGLAGLEAFLLVLATVGLLVGTAISEREATAARLKEANENERALVDSCAVAVVAVGLDGRVLTWNPAAERIFGYSRDEVIGRPLPYIPEDRADEYARLRDLHLRGEGLTGFETVRRRKDGSPVDVRISLAPIHDAAGRLTGTLGTLEDLTERRASREAGERLTAILEATSDLVAIADTDGEIVYLNAGGRRMLGLDPGEVVVGRSLGELHPPWAARRVLEQGIPTATRDGLWSGETAVLARSGEEIPVLQLILAHADSRGSLQYLSTVVRDIRAQKAAERALLARNELLEKVFDSSPLMLALMRPEGTVEWANRPWERTLGWSVPEMQGRDMLGEFFPDPEQRARAAELIRAADGKWQDLRTRTRSGRVITTAWANVRLSDGTVIGLGQDVSERRSLEERLHHSQKMEAVGQLAGGVAHDFNNVLTSVMGYTEALLDELEAGSPLRADALEIRKAAERAAALTRQLLTFSRKQLIELEVLDLNHAVAGIGTMLRRLLGGSIELRTDLADGLGRVRADAGQLDQVIVNLAVNARDAMPEGGVLTIRTRNVTLDRTYEAVRAGLPAGPYVALVMTDTGAGMDEAVQARIFEPFFTTKDRAHGTGLGLATVYGIVKQSGGAIEVWSAPGQGATFTVYLPREEAPAPSAAIAAPDGAPPSGVETVLLVEDEEPVRKLACRALRRAGYRVLEAADPDRAVELSRRFSGPIDLVLSDVMMTGRTGPQLVSLLRAERPEFRVLYMSGFADGLLPEGTDGDDFLPKPFTPRRLANKVREVLDR